MDDKSYASPLSVAIKPSQKLLLMMVCLHLLASGVVLIIEISVLFKVAVSLLILASFGLFLCQYGYLKGAGFLSSRCRPVSFLDWDASDNWLLVEGNETEQRAMLSSPTFVHHRITIVNLKLEDRPWWRKNRSFIFLKDNIDTETFRRLRVRLRWYSSQERDSSLALK